MNRKPSRTLGPTSDLVILAPWKEGIIEADEAILPASRLAITFRTLFQIRQTARESVAVSAFSDPVERIEQIHSFRLKATPEGMLLSVTYDFGWEPYMRSLWDDKGAGAFLDLLCCHCADYPLARDTPLDQWAKWIRSREIVSDYFYSATALTVGDLSALSQAERQQRDDPLAQRGDRKLARFSSLSPVTLAAKVRQDPSMTRLVTKQALGILTAMYRLSRFYGPDIGNAALGGDALTLLRAARSLLEKYRFEDLSPAISKQFERELAWYRQSGPSVPNKVAQAKVNPKNVQRGILTSFDKPATITHGAVLFLGVRDGEDDKARNSLAGLKLASEAAKIRKGEIFRNVALTYEGMRRLKLPANLLDTMPAAFREGAQARATQVGDLRAFHPDRWQSLPMNWPAGRRGQAALSLVDAMIQLRVASASKVDDIHDLSHPLHAEIAAIATLPGLRLLSVEALNPADRNKPGMDHLGLRDGISQPQISGGSGKEWSDRVAAGELLLGYPNDAGDPPTSDPLLKDGSFLAVRRMPLKPWIFEKLLEDEAAKNCVTSELVAAKIVGRKRDGTPLVSCHGPNDFRYDQDGPGLLCPRQSHIRRLNPRPNPAGGAKVPRISRRGMSFGTADSAERGSMFMAYCANLAEQYEVLLRWLNGGNNSRIGSYLPDPLCSVPVERSERTLRVAHEADLIRIELPEAAESFISLSWSLYLFAPPLDFLPKLPGMEVEDARRDIEPLPQVRLSCPVSASRSASTALVADPLETGRRIIKWLQTSGAGQAEWRNYLDEPIARENGWQDAVWTAIRRDHGGFLDTPAGYLVGSHALVMQVLRDDGRNFSVREAGRRIKPSLGSFHLGLDAFTPAYQQEAPTCNHALSAISEAASFDKARSCAKAILGAILASSPHPVRIDVLKDLLEPAAACMSPIWFGLPNERDVWKGVSDWRDPITKVLFPGHFWNSSRYAFNPFTSAETERLSAIHGKAAIAAVTAYVNRTGRMHLNGSVAAAIGMDHASYPSNADVARVITGAMMGWIATTLGTGSRLLEDWISKGEFARQQIGWDERGSKTAADARLHFGPEMEKTIGRGPVPENKHRIVAHDEVTLAGKKLQKDKMVVLGLESAWEDQADSNIHDSHVYFGLAVGGARPPHGCPAKDMAFGMLLGLLAAMAETISVRYGEGRLLADISPFS